MTARITTWYTRRTATYETIPYSLSILGRISPLEPEGNIVDKFMKNANILWEKKFKLQSEIRKKIIIIWKGMKGKKHRKRRLG